MDRRQLHIFKLVSSIMSTFVLNNFLFFHTSRNLVENKQKIASLDKDRPSKGKKTNNQNWKEKNKKLGKQLFDVSVVRLA